MITAQLSNETLKPPCQSALFEEILKSSKEIMKVKVFNWPELHSGDCILEANGSVYIFENGYYVIRGRVRSSDTNDTWQFKINLFTSSDGFLEHLPVYASWWNVEMKEADKWYDFEIKEFSIDQGNSRLAQIYNNISKANMEHNC